MSFTTSPSSSSSSSSPPPAYPLWVPAPLFEGADPDLVQISKTNILTGKQHRNRLRDSQAHLSSETLEWTRHLVKRNVMANDCFIAFANGELLCLILNTVCPSDPPIPITPGAPVKSAEARGHVGAFLRSAARLGVQQHHLFKPKDLMKRSNDRRVMRTILYFQLALMKFGALPIPSLHPRITKLCTSTGYAFPEVLTVGKNLLGRFGSGYVRPTTQGGANGSGSGSVMAGKQSSQQPIIPLESEHARRARLERERLEREARAAEFRPQLHFMGGNRHAKKKNTTQAQGEVSSSELVSSYPASSPPPPSSSSSSDPNVTNSTPQKVGIDVYSTDSRFTPHLNKNNYDSPVRTPVDTQGQFHDRSSSINHTSSNIGILSNDPLGNSIPSFPHPSGERFEMSLQNMDLTEMLHSESDETDIDKPMIAALLFPAFGESTNLEGPNIGPNGKELKNSHGAWQRTSAQLHVHVEPIKFAMWISRHPFKSLLTILGIFIFFIIITFGPYPSPFRIDLATESFHAIDDKYTSFQNRYKSAVQASREYVTYAENTFILTTLDPKRMVQLEFERQDATLQSFDESNTKDLHPPQRQRFTSLMSELLVHDASIVSVAKAVDQLAGIWSPPKPTPATTPLQLHTDDAAADAAPTWSERLIAGLLDAAGGGEVERVRRERARGKIIEKARAKLEEDEKRENNDHPTNDDDNTSRISSQPPPSSSSSSSSRRLSSFSTDYPIGSIAGTQLDVIYIGQGSLTSSLGSLLVPKRLEMIRNFEVSLAQQYEYRHYCYHSPISRPTTTLDLSQSEEVRLKTGRPLGCQFPDSIINYYSARLDQDKGVLYLDGANMTSIQNVTTINALLQNWGRKGFFDRGFDMDVSPSSVTSRHAISSITFGVPLSNGVDWERDEQLDWLQNAVLDRYIDLVTDTSLDEGTVTMAIDGPQVQSRILRNIIFGHDIKLIIGAIFAFIAYAVLHIRSLFLVTSSIIQIIIAFFITTFWYRVVFQQDVLNILHVICLFVILALGTNDLFILWDTFWHSSLLRLRVELPYDRAIRKKSQEELAYRTRQSDRTFHGACMRLWYDDSYLYTMWKFVRNWIPGLIVTDYDLNEHFQTTTTASTTPGGGGTNNNNANGSGDNQNPLQTNLNGNANRQANNHSMLPNGGGDVSVVPGRSGPVGQTNSSGSTNPFGVGSAVGGIVGVRPRIVRRLSGSHSSTPTRLQRDSDDDDDDEFDSPSRTMPPMAMSAVAAAADPGLPGPRVHPPPWAQANGANSPSQHRRLGSQELNPIARDEEPLTESIPEDSHPIANGWGTPPTYKTKPRTGVRPNASSGASSGASQNADDDDDFPGRSAPGRNLGFVGSSRSSAAVELDRQRTAQMLATIQKMDGPELEDEDEIENLEAMASRHGGLKSAIERKQADRVALRLSWTYRRAVPSMLITNSTIIIALYAIAISSIGPIKEFGLLMGTVALINFLLSLTFLPTMIVLQYMHFRRFSILPRSWWNKVRAVTAKVDERVHKGDIKYDDAILDDQNQANKPNQPSNDPTHVHSSATGGGVGRDLVTQRVTVRSAGSFNADNGVDGESGGEGIGGGPHIRGGVNFTKDPDDDMNDTFELPTSSRPDGNIGGGGVDAASSSVHHQRNPSPLDPVAVAPLLAHAAPAQGILVKRGLKSRLDVERAKANASLERSRRNQFLLFLNATIFRFRIVFIVIWVAVLAYCLSQAVELEVPQEIITLLPPDSNIEVLKAAYAELPSCTSCRYEFDRAEHQVIPFIDGLPVTVDTGMDDSVAQGGDASVTTQSMKKRQVVTMSAPNENESHAQPSTKRLVHTQSMVGNTPDIHDPNSFGSVSSLTATSPSPSPAAPSSASTVDDDASVVHPHERLAAHLSSPIFRPRSAFHSTPIRNVRDLFRSSSNRPSSSVRHVSTSFSTLSNSDFITTSIGVPSSPPMLEVRSSFITHNTFRITFAQSVFAGLQPILRYELVITPVNTDGSSSSTDVTSTTTTFTTSPVTCGDSRAGRVSKMIVTIRPKLAQADLSPLTTCIVTDNTTCVTTSSNPANLNPVQLQSDWFSSATIFGGTNMPGLTYTESGSLVNDLSGFVHNTEYDIELYALSAAGSSLPSVKRRFRTLDGTPPQPAITQASIVTAGQYQDAQSNSNSQWTINVKVDLKYVLDSSTPPPTSVTIYWTSSSTATTALPSNGQIESQTFDVTTLVNACTTLSECIITLPTISTTQLRGGTSVYLTATTTNAHATSARSSQVLASVPVHTPFAPVILGYTVGTDVVTPFNFLKPTIRLFFQLPSLNRGTTTLLPTSIQLFYKKNAALINEADMSKSSVASWSTTVKLATTDQPLDSLSIILPVNEAPIWQVDFGTEQDCTFIANTIYYLKLKIYGGGAQSLPSSSSPPKIVATPMSPVLAPALSNLEYSSSEGSLKVTYTPPQGFAYNPNPTYKYHILITPPNPTYQEDRATPFNAAIITTDLTYTLTGLAPNSQYYLALMTSTDYSRSYETSPIQCFMTTSGSLSLNGNTISSLSSCPTVGWNQLCFGQFDGSQSTCATKTQIRDTPVDQVFIYQGGRVPESFTMTRRFRLSNGIDSTKTLSIGAVSSLPLQPLDTFRSPSDVNVRCLDTTTSTGSKGYDLYEKIPAGCYVPCLSSSCASICGQVTLSVQSNAGRLGLQASRTTPYAGVTSTLDATIGANQLDTTFDIVVKPSTDLTPGLYSCGFNFKTFTTDSTGGVTDTLGYVSDVEREVQGPFDLIVAVRVLPADRPMPVRDIQYGDITETTSSGSTVQAKNITFTIPWSPSSNPICSFELQYQEFDSSTQLPTSSSKTSLFISTPTASEGFTIQARVYGFSTSSSTSIHFSIRAYNSIGARDYESEVHTEDCSNAPFVTSEGTSLSKGLQKCNGQGSCQTARYVFIQTTRGVMTTETPIETKYTILSSMINHPMTTSDVPIVVAGAGCQCQTGTYGRTCKEQCPSNTPVVIVDGAIVPTKSDFDPTCSGRGSCDTITHVCTCEYGFGGTACEQSCPNSCNYRGECEVNDGGEPYCKCIGYWGGFQCQTLCPLGENGIPCSGYGSCSLFGKCVCDMQHRGPTCERECPGSYQTSNGTMKVCNGRGSCFPNYEAPITITPYCQCEDPLDTSNDCGRNAGGNQIENVHYDLPIAPQLPSFIFPIIHLVWGVESFTGSSGNDGVSSATETGADGSSVSFAASLNAGTPHWYKSFDFTDPEAQQFYRTVCDVVFISGLITESASTCLMTAFEAYNAKTTNPGATGSFPLASSQVTGAWVKFLASLKDEQKIWRQHVGFLFSTEPFTTTSSSSSSSETSSTFEPMGNIHQFRARRAAGESSSSSSSRSNLFSSLFSSSSSSSPLAELDTGVDAVYLNYDQLDYILQHPQRGDKFHIHLHGEAEETMSSTTQSRRQRNGVEPTLYVKICYFAMEFYATFDELTTTAKFQEQYADAWNDLIDSHINPSAPSTVGPGFHAADVWTKMSRQLAFERGVILGFVVMFIFIFFFTFIFTGWNWKLALLVIFTILCLVCLLFGILVSTDRQLGVIEYISSQIVIALSVHYLLYIGHAYIISPFNTRFGRTRHGLLEWGASILSSGIAMMISSFVLMFATIKVLSTMGEILCIMAIVFMLFTLTFYIPLLQCIGPIGFDPKANEKKANENDTNNDKTNDAASSSPALGSDSDAQPPVSERTVDSDGFATDRHAAPPLQSSFGIGVRGGSGDDASVDARSSPDPMLRGGGGFSSGVGRSIPPIDADHRDGAGTSIELTAIRHGPVGTPARHERKPGGTAPNPHAFDTLKKTHSGNLQLSSSEDEDESMGSPLVGPTKPPGMASPTSRFGMQSPKPIQLEKTAQPSSSSSNDDPKPDDSSRIASRSLLRRGVVGGDDNANGMLAPSLSSHPSSSPGPSPRRDGSRLTLPSGLPDVLTRMRQPTPTAEDAASNIASPSGSPPMEARQLTYPPTASASASPLPALKKNRLKPPSPSKPVEGGANGIANSWDDDETPTVTPKVSMIDEKPKSSSHLTTTTTTQPSSFDDDDDNMNGSNSNPLRPKSFLETKFGRSAVPTPTPSPPLPSNEVELSIDVDDSNGYDHDVVHRSKRSGNGAGAGGSSSLTRLNPLDRRSHASSSSSLPALKGRKPDLKPLGAAKMPIKKNDQTNTTTTTTTTMMLNKKNAAGDVEEEVELDIDDDDDDDQPTVTTIHHGATTRPTQRAAPLEDDEVIEIEHDWDD